MRAFKRKWIAKTKALTLYSKIHVPMVTYLSMGIAQKEMNVNHERLMLIKRTRMLLLANGNYLRYANGK